MIIPASFRLDWPEFTSVALYPTPVVSFWLTVAGLLLRTERWGNGSATATNPPTTIYDVATELFVAHNLVLERQAAKTASAGGTPGVSKGPVASMSVNGVSIGYDTASGLEEGAGHWNLTTYGTRLKRLMDLFGAGPVQVGIGLDPFGWYGPSGSPWVGPPPWPGETSFG